MEKKMSDPHEKNQGEAIADDGDGPDIETRREFLRSLSKWSAIVIGGVALGGMIEPPNAAGWLNGGGGGGWVNARGGGGWINGGGGGGGWVNARGGGGGGWINRR
jgi:hypothetical protein